MSKEKNKGGRPKTPNPKIDRISVSVTPQTKTQLKTEATQRGVSLSKHINDKLKK